jgi:uncharacterized RDD family membrane protein YckC
MVSPDPFTSSQPHPQPQTTPAQGAPAPPGWYPDPSGAPGHRWWNGIGWTAYTSGPTPYPGPAPYATVDPSLTVTTAAGVAVLAGWWRRFGGYVIDVLIVDGAGLAVTLLIRDVDQHVRGPLSPGLHPMTYVAQALVLTISIAILILYPLLFLRARGQTLGMMAVGVVAVDAQSGAAISTPQAWRRVLAFFFLAQVWVQVGSLIGFNHVSGGPRPAGETLFILLGLAGIVTTAIVAAASPKKQTLQDKGAGTLVVVRR